MPFVVDASVTANWLLPDEQPEAMEAWRRIASDPALVPLHWWFEVRNILATAERHGRISRQSTDYVLDRASRLRVTLMPLPNDRAVLDLARQRRLTFYDAAYLELAQREGVALATLDRALTRAAQAEGIPLVLATE
jgi:predicted nucleic acid-binding protein